MILTGPESAPKWTVKKGESGRSLKWTDARKWTVRPKVDGPETNWRSLETKWTVMGQSRRSFE